MEEKKKLNFKIIIPIVIAIVVVVVVGIKFIINKNDPEESCIGTWKISNNENYYNSNLYETIEIYKGGTGKLGKDTIQKNGSIVTSYQYTFTWEVKGNILNITYTDVINNPHYTGYKIKNDTMTTIDGNVTYKKVNN